MKTWFNQLAVICGKDNVPEALRKSFYLFTVVRVLTWAILIWTARHNWTVLAVYIIGSFSILGFPLLAIYMDITTLMEDLFGLPVQSWMDDDFKPNRLGWLTLGLFVFVLVLVAASRDYPIAYFLLIATALFHCLMPVSERNGRNDWYSDM
ncbi:hypothetical protein HY256_04550 [Candidatus Sumerlaeota bacterium]|nr:hypothetical protein [Candidatus Sumerlaeota bacterium]